MEVTLVYPSIRNAGFNTLGHTSESCWINHGLTSLSACLKKDKYKVRLLDFRDMKNWRDIEQWIKQDPATEYGITMATLDYHEAIKAAETIHKIKPHAHITVGGPHPSIMPEEVAQHKVFNHIIVGEAEVTYPELIQRPEAYNKIVKGDRPQLDLLPFEAREIFNLKKIFNSKNSSGKEWFPMPFINVISGRGCVWRCGFCKPGEDKIFGKFRMRSIEHFFGEIQKLDHQYHFQTLMIDDDSFTLFPNYTLAFCEMYEKKIHKPFYCQSRADFIVDNPDVMKRMKQAGLDTVFVGFESGSQRMLGFMQKDTTVEQNLEAAEICHRLGIKIWANFMIGLPTETKEEMTATMNMIKKINPWKPSGAFFTPIVGTHLYDYCKQNNLFVSEDPAILGSRNPSVPKIKGLDYPWMMKQMYPSPLWKRVAKKTLKTLKLH
jgi:anaerobic magnesium-protoporphyrin IX monomethyl ester cyclase